jgi:hypothetical protein
VFLPGDGIGDGTNVGDSSADESLKEMGRNLGAMSLTAGMRHRGKRFRGCDVDYPLPLTDHVDAEDILGLDSDVHWV